MTERVTGWLLAMCVNVGLLAGCAPNFFTRHQESTNTVVDCETNKHEVSWPPAQENHSPLPAQPPLPHTPYGFISWDLPRPLPATTGAVVSLPVAGPLLELSKEAPTIQQTSHPDILLLPPTSVEQKWASGPLPNQTGATQSTTVRKALAPEEARKKEPLLDALQCVLEERPHEALTYLQGYDPATQELLLRLLPYLDLIRRKGLPQLQSEEVAILHHQLQEMMHLLRPRTELAIDKACFCEFVKAFGVYQPLPEDHVFGASTPERPGELVQLYVELRNFCSEPRGPYHETCLSSSVEVRDARGEKIWQHRFDDCKQPLRSRARLNDYFNNYTFHVPQLPPGTYTLTIQVADETRPDRQRQASKTLEFRLRSLPGRNP